MIRYRSLTAFAVLISLSRVVGAAEGPVLFKAVASETITVTLDEESSAARTKQVSVDFHKLHLYAPEEVELIAKETITKEFVDSTDGESASAQVDIFFRQPDGKFPAKPDHSTTMPEASEVEFKQDHWTGTIYGCCDAEPYTELYAYGQNKPFLSANGKYAQVVLPNANIMRYVGVVLRSQTATEDVERALFGKNKKAMAVILYAGPGKPLQKLYLQAKPGVNETEVPYHTLDLDLKSKSSRDEDGYNEDRDLAKVLTMWSQDSVPGKKAPTSVSGLTIVASFSGNDGNPETVSIPVENDKFGKAKLSGQTMQVVSEP